MLKANPFDIQLPDRLCNFSGVTKTLKDVQVSQQQMALLKPLELSDTKLDDTN